MVSNAFQNEEAAGRCLYIHGPQSITMYDAFQRVCKLLHPKIAEISVMPIHVAQQVAESTGNQMLGFFATVMDYFQKVGEPGDPTEVNTILGASLQT